MSNFKTVLVQFENASNNYFTSVNGKLSDEEIQRYFIGKRFDLGIYPNEDLQMCIGCTIVPPPPTDEQVKASQVL